MQLFANEDSTATGDIDSGSDNHYSTRIDDEIRKIVADIITNNAKLRKRVNSHLRHRLKSYIMSKTNDSSEI